MTRLVLIGLDGGTDAVIGLPDADLPNIAALRRDGASATVASTIPPVTAAAWPSLMTGWNPGRHGLYDFRELAIERYARPWGAGQPAAFAEGREFLTSRRWAGAALWDLVPAGWRVGVLSVPMTYPPWPVGGELVAGFPLPDYRRNSTWPPELAPRLPPLLEGADRLGSLADADLAAVCARMVERQRAVLLRWLREGRFDVVVAVFQGTDFAQHRLWRALDRRGDPLRDALLGLYRAIDATVGEARSLVGSGGTVAVASDHGFGPHPATQVRTDAVLAAAGLLVPARAGARPGLAARVLGPRAALRRRLRLTGDRLPERVKAALAERLSGAQQVDWPATQAYRVALYGPAEGVVVNLRGRQAQGAVEPGAAYERVRDRVVATLAGLRDPAAGTPVVRLVRRREELYAGPHVEAAPDVVALFEPGYTAAAGLGEPFAPVPAGVRDRFPGVHAMEGVFAVAGPGVRAGVDLGTRDIVDVAPTLLALLGIPVPRDADGAPIAEALREPAAATVGAARAAAPEDPAPALTPEEEATLRRSLRALGYLE